MKRKIPSRKTGPPGKFLWKIPLLKTFSLLNKNTLTKINIMNTSLLTSRIKNSLRMATGLSLSIFMIASTSGTAQAAILFQDDTFHDIDSEAILIDSNGTGADNTSIQFGNDVTPANNGTILWDVADDEFQISNTIDLDGFVDMRNAEAVHIQESPDPDTVTGCDILGEIILDTTDNEIQICTAIGADSVQSTGSVVVTGGTGGDTYDVVIGGVGAGGAVPFNTSLAQTAIDIATDITDNVAGYSAEAVGTTVNITADIGGTAGDATVVTGLTGTAAVTDNNTTGGVNGGATWTAPSASDASTLDGLDSLQFLRADVSDVYGSGAGAETLTIGDGTNADGLLGAANSVINFGASDTFIIPTGTDNSPGDACTAGELYFDTDTSQLLTCGSGNTFEASSPQDFEDIYAYDADNTLTASGTFDIDAVGAVGIDSDAAVTVGGAGVGITSDSGILSLTGDGTADIDVSNVGASLDFDSATFTLDTSAGFSVDGGAASNVSTSAGALTVSGGDGVNIDGTGQEIDITSTGGAIDVNGATFDVDTTGAVSIQAAADSDITTTGVSDISLNAGDDLIFDDAQLSGTVQLSEADSDWDLAFNTDGMVDNINDLATQLGNGADNDISTFDFTEDANVLADDDTVYAALEKLNNKWGDLASTANGEGASLIGVEDSGGNFTATDVEGVLTEIAGQIGSNAANVETMTFEPEYENVVVFQDGSNNRGRLDADYDDTNREQYYRWTSRQNSSNDIDLRFRVELPADFVTGGDLDLQIFSDTNVVGDNSIAIIIRDDTANTTCHTEAAQAASAGGAWETLTIDAVDINSCTLTAGDVVEIQIKLAADNTSSGGMQVGTIDYAYTN